MYITTFETERKKKIERYGGLLLLALAGFFVFVCTPVYVLASSNIMISRTVFPILWDLVQDVVHYLYYWIAFSFLTYLTARYSMKSTWFISLVYTGCSFAKYFFSVLVVNLINSDWTSMNYHFYYVMVDFLGDITLLGIALLLCYLLLHRKRAKKSIDFDFFGMFDFSAPVLKCVLIISLALMLGRLGSRIIFDIDNGAPRGSFDLLVMILYYLGDIASGVIGYLLMFLVVSQIRLKDEEAIQLQK